MRQLLVCGGRDYSFSDEDYAMLDELHERYRFTEVIHGHASGADACADTWARDRDVSTTRFPADWRTHGKAAGFIRNAEMIQYVMDSCIVIAFPGGRGTEDTIRRATKGGLEVLYG